MERLSERQVEEFIEEGFVKLENAFPQHVAEECRTLLWEATGCDPNDPQTWTQPVVRIGEMGLEPFKKAANTPLLLKAFDQLAGEGNWFPPKTIGSFPIRFPTKEQASDTGWHVDASFAGDNISDYFAWRINIRSRGRALLMLFLFSDVGEFDAPTRIRAGSHFDVAKILRPAREKGLSFTELAGRLDLSNDRKELVATGKAGTVYLCHPFLVHAAQAHRGKVPKFMAQPSLVAKGAFNLRHDDNNHCPVEKAILKGLAR